MTDDGGLMRTSLLRGVAAISALTLCACDGAVIVTTPGGPSAAPNIVISIGAPVVARPPGVVYMNVTSPIQVCNISVWTSMTVDVHQVTIHMIDGSNPGGPIVTVPRAELTNQFGSTRVIAGTTRTFPLRLPFSLTWSPRPMGASIIVLDPHGAEHRVIARGACP
jgi:hypothetical protein